MLNKLAFIKAILSWKTNICMLAVFGCIDTNCISLVASFVTLSEAFWVEEGVLLSERVGG